MLEIDNTPFPARRQVASKYDEVFSKMRPGQCVKVDRDNAQNIAQAMRKWLVKHNKWDDLRVAVATHMPDGISRVWMLPRKPTKMADLPARKVSKLAI